MSIADDIKTILTADSGAGGVYTLMTGGIYTYENTGRLGISLTNTASAYDSTTGKLKPCLLIKERAEVPDNGVYDDATQEISYRQIVELWWYDDGDTGWSTLKTARNRAFVVLHGKTVGSTKNIPRWAGTPIRDARDAALSYACILRDDYDVRAVMG